MKQELEYSSIFERCIDCNQLLLKSNPYHQCGRKTTKRDWNLLEEIFQILDKNNTELSRVEICRILNKSFGYTKFTQFEIGYHMSKKPEIFYKSSREFYFGLKIWETQS